VREPPKLTMPTPGEPRDPAYLRMCREMNALAEWMAEAFAEVSQSQRPEAQTSDILWQCSVCREMVPEHRHLEHQQAHTMQRAVTNQDLWEWSELVRHLARPCPDCTPDAPCDRVRGLIGG
jgi:hypothetical protein